MPAKGTYIPPHLRNQSEAVTTNENANIYDVSYQRESWDHITKSVISSINLLTSQNVQKMAKNLFQVNLIRGRGILTRALIRFQQKNSNATPLLCSLISVINKKLPLVGLFIVKRVIIQWQRIRRRGQDIAILDTIAKFIAWLYNFGIVEITLPIQLLLELLEGENRTDEDIELSGHFLKECFPTMAKSEPQLFHTEVLETFRHLLSGGDDGSSLSPRSQVAIEECLRHIQAWHRDSFDTPIINQALCLVPLDEQVTHSIDLSEKLDPEERLDRFEFHPHFEEEERDYKTLCGEVLELDTASTSSVDEENDVIIEDPEVSNLISDTQSIELSSKTDTMLPSDDENRIRREIYLIMRNSIRADEAVHKLLLKKNFYQEHVVCFMILEGCCEEKSFRKIYPMVAERLCKSVFSFQNLFIEAFHERYRQADGLENRKIEHLGLLYAHLLRTNAVNWGPCLSVVNLLDSYASQRILIQTLLQNLVENLGQAEVKHRFCHDTELEKKVVNMFPMNSKNPMETELVIQLYEQMGVGFLAEKLRTWIQSQKKNTKRARTDTA